MFSQLFAKQLGGPSAVLGQWFFAPVWNRRNAALNEMALAGLDLGVDDQVLEIGFGGGYLLGKILSLVTAAFIAGVDVSPVMVSYCDKRYRPAIQAGKLELRASSAEQLPYAAGRFNRVCSVNSICPG